MRIINLTPHAVTVFDAEGATIQTLPAAQTPARAQQQNFPNLPIGAIPTVTISYGPPENLPEPTPGVFLLVSQITARAATEAGRPVHDLLLTADAVRDTGGRIIGCRALARVATDGNG
jgi:hypothetical protein